jgi:hypothetical protein
VQVENISITAEVSIAQLWSKKHVGVHKKLLSFYGMDHELLGNIIRGKVM